MQVWSVDDSDISDVVYRRGNATDSYTEVTIGDINPGRSNGDVALSRQLDDRDNPYSVTSMSGIFSNMVSKYALARQLAARLVQRHEMYCFTAGPRATLWEVGDKLKITSTRNRLSDTVFTLTSKKGSPLSGSYQIETIRWPDTPALQSTWEDTDIQGIYRLAEWDTGSATGANQSPVGSAGSLTVNTLNGLSYIDWRGPVANVDLDAPATWFPSFTNYDLCDFILAIYGDQDTEPYSSTGPDETYTIIMKCQDATPSDNALCVYIKRTERPDGHGGTYVPTTDLRIGMGYTLDYLNDPISWEDHVESAPGFSTNSDSWIYGIAVQWHGTEARLYIDRELVGSITTRNSDLTDVSFYTPVSTEHKIGCIRWLQKTDDWFDADRLVGQPGDDNYYP